MTCVCLIFVALLLSIGNAVEPLIQARFSEIVGMAASQLEQRDGPLDDGARYRKGPMRSSVRIVVAYMRIADVVRPASFVQCAKTQDCNRVELVNLPPW